MPHAHEVLPEQPVRPDTQQAAPGQHVGEPQQQPVSMAQQPATAQTCAPASQLYSQMFAQATRRMVDPPQNVSATFQLPPPPPPPPAQQQQQQLQQQQQ